MKKEHHIDQKRSPFSRFSLLSLLGLFSLLTANAQHTFQGVVTDAATGEAVEMATVQLLWGSSEKLVNYTLTNANGRFSIKTNRVDSLQILVSLLGYKMYKMPLLSDQALVISLEQEAFALREVEIRPGRLYGNRDTINYDVTQYLSAKDETIKDVLKKLPGVDVDETGKISYNGKDISNFYVEGMDLTDGRYNQMAANLDAKAVETVQLLENHQPIRLLQDKIKTENVAMNLKLKPEFKDKWMLTLQAGVGGSPILWDGWANALQLSRKSQSGYIYKGNNRGYDVADENIRFFNQAAGRLQEPGVPRFLSQPSIIAPLKKDRLLFNDIHSLTANRLYRLNETTQLRINTAYSHDRREQTRGSETSYFQQNDTIRVAEQSNSRIRSDQAEVTLNLENNADDRYLTNKFKASGDWSRSSSDFTGSSTVSQQIKTPDMALRNDFRNLWERDAYTYEVNSVIRYNYQPAELIVNSLKQDMNLNHLYTDNSFSAIRKQGYVTHQYSAGFTGQLNSEQNGYSLYAYPTWQWNKDKWQTRFSVPVVWTRYPEGDFSRVAANPSLFLSYKYNYAWRFYFSGSYREQYPDVTYFRTSLYPTDYRHSIQNEGSLPVQQHQFYALYGEYKHTIYEFFATLSLNHNRNRFSHMYEQRIEGNQVTRVSHKQSNQAESWSVRGTLSKGFYDQGLKVSLDYQYSHNQAEQLSHGERLPYESNVFQLDPKVSWNPSRYFEAAYEAALRCRDSRIGEGTHLPSLWSVVQKLHVSYIAFPIEINLSGDHYYNELNSTQSVRDFFADVSFKWKNADWQFAASVTNLFDKKQYRYTEYSSIQSYTSWIDIRGREFLVSARYKF